MFRPYCSLSDARANPPAKQFLRPAIHVVEKGKGKEKRTFHTCAARQLHRASVGAEFPSDGNLTTIYSDNKSN